MPTHNHQPQGHNISTNAWHIPASAAWRVAALAGGRACFDLAYYIEANPDLSPEWTVDELWAHFVHAGQFEPSRPFRWAAAGGLGSSGVIREGSFS